METTYNLIKNSDNGDLKACTPTNVFLNYSYVCII